MALPLLQSCEGDYPYGIEASKDITLQTDNSQITFDKTLEEDVTIRATDGLAWEATTHDSWISITPWRGTGRGTIKIAVEPNPNTTPRYGHIQVISRFDKYESINVTQLGTYFKVTEYGSNVSSLSFNSSADSKTVTIETNSNWTVSTYPDWLTVSPSSGIVGNASVTFYARENTGDNRSGSILFRHAAGRFSLSVEQEGTLLQIRMSSYDYIKEGDWWGLYVENIPYNRSWTASSSQSWARFRSYSGNTTYTATGPGSVFVYVNPNDKAEKRYATITVKSGSTTKTLQISQEAATVSTLSATTPYNIYSYDNYNTSSFHISSNTSWKITKASDGYWLTVSPMSGTGDQRIDLSAGYNGYPAPSRDTYLTIETTGKGYTKKSISVKVHQY